MNKTLLGILLLIPAIALAGFRDHDGHLQVTWQAPEYGTPLSHYIWSYTINGQDDSLTGTASAGDTINAAVTLGAIGDWAIFKIRAVSLVYDTSTWAVTDTVIYDPELGIDPDGNDDLNTQPAALALQAHPNPTDRSGLVLSWQVDRESNYNIAIFDILGRKVRTLREERMPVGSYNQHFGEGLMSGTYFAIIARPDSRRIVKFTILR